MVTDRGRSYDAQALSGVKQQKCLAHVLRSISEVVQTKRGRGRSFGNRLSREAKWGPAFVLVGDDMEHDWPIWPENFRNDALLLVDLLAVTHELQVVSAGWRTSGVERRDDAFGAPISATFEYGKACDDQIAGTIAGRKHNCNNYRIASLVVWPRSE